MLMRTLLLISASLTLASSHAFGQDHAFRTVSIPGAQHTFLRGVDSSGRVVGSSWTMGDRERAFIDDAGVVSVFDYPDALHTRFHAIDDSGTIIGDYFGVPPSGSSGPFMLRGGSATPLPTMPPWGISYSGIASNGTGLIVGTAGLVDTMLGVLFDGQGFTTVFFTQGGGTSLGDINDLGIAVGSWYSMGGGGGGPSSDVFTYNFNDQTYTSLWPAGEEIAQLNGINNAGEVVGRAGIGVGGRAIHYSNNQWRELDVPGASNSEATDIGETNVICGFYSGSYLGNYGTHGFVATPISNAPANLCSALPNSTGSSSRMRWQGSISVADDNLLLMAEDCPLDSIGIFFFGAAQSQVPFGDGNLCVTGRTHRFAVTRTDSYGIAWQDFGYPPSPITGSAITPGTTWYFQYMFQDPGFGTHGFNLSDALEVTFQ